MPTLARKLSLWNYFALGFGTMIGTGWVVLMDDWLGRGGPLGAMLGFALGGILLLPVAYTYGQWVRRLPDAAGEAAYTAEVFPPFVGYLTGWIMLLAYLIVCPWEAVAVGKLAAYLFPQLDAIELYRVAGVPVFLPRLLLGLLLTLFLGYLNYRGIRASATFQNWATSAVLLVFFVMVAISGRSGAPAHLQPLFSHAPLVSVLLTLQIVPYFVTGFESVPKVAEEAHPGFPPGDFFKAIAMALLVGAGFYVLVIGAVSYIAPWQGLLGQRFATAIAFEQGAHSVAIARVFAKVQPTYQTPTAAILAVSVATLAGLLLGDALLVPVTEVGSMAPAFGWLATCLSFYMVERSVLLRLTAGLGMAVSLLLVLMKLLPIFPGHFSLAEWIALGIWLAIGLLLHYRS